MTHEDKSSKFNELLENDNSVSTIIKTCKLCQRKCTRYQIQFVIFNP